MKEMLNKNTQSLSLPKKIAYLEDDDFAADVFNLALSQENYEICRFKTICEATEALSTEKFDLLIFDWLLPDGTADKLIRLVREELAFKAPIMIVSMYDAEEKVVDALLLGANDYVVKPIRKSELQARIRVLLRDIQTDNTDKTVAPGFHLDEENKQLFHSEIPLNLTLIEYNLLLYFFSNMGELLSREKLLKAIWGKNANVDTRTVDTFIARLRKHLKTLPDSSIQIETLRGYGYRMVLIDS